MNSIADYYELPGLATNSMNKAKDILREEWSVDSLGDLLRESLGSTGDQRFFRMLSEIAADHFGEIADSHMLDESALAQGFAPYLLPVAIRSVMAAEAGRRDALRVSKDLNSRVKLLETHSSCQNITCGALSPQLEPDSLRSSYLLRCARCRCRHT